MNNDKLLKIHDVSLVVMDKYLALLSLNKDDIVEFISYRLTLEEIRESVIEEYNLLSDLSLDEINEYLEKLKFISSDKLDYAYLRLKNRLMRFVDIKKGHKDYGNFLNIPMIPNNMEFSVIDMILSMVFIKFIKMIKCKIDNLNITCNSDKLFVDELFKIYNQMAFNHFCSCDMIEMIVLCNEFDIDKVDNININNVMEITNRVYSSRMDNNLLYDIITNYGKIAIDELSLINNVKNAPRDVCSYLFAVTKFEAIIDYLDKDSLLKLMDYCDKIENNISLINVKRLIKNRINN